jgi:hypothetical protein
MAGLFSNPKRKKRISPNYRSSDITVIFKLTIGVFPSFLGVQYETVVPDQHAAFGITRATQKAREPVWKDLALERLVKRAPTERPVPKLPR